MGANVSASCLNARSHRRKVTHVIRHTKFNKSQAMPNQALLLRVRARIAQRIQDAKLDELKLKAEPMQIDRSTNAPKTVGQKTHVQKDSASMNLKNSRAAKPKLLMNNAERQGEMRDHRTKADIAVGGLRKKRMESEAVARLLSCTSLTERDYRVTPRGGVR